MFKRGISLFMALCMMCAIVPTGFAEESISIAPQSISVPAPQSISIPTVPTITPAESIPTSTPAQSTPSAASQSVPASVPAQSSSTLASASQSVPASVPAQSSSTPASASQSVPASVPAQSAGNSTSNSEANALPVGNAASAATPYAGTTYTLQYADNATGGVTITGYTGTASGDLVLPEMLGGKKVTAIGDKAFRDCRNLTGSLTIPSGVTSIGAFAFRNCQNLTGGLTIPSGVTTIGESAFENCENLTGNLTIPSNVTNIGESAFKNCKNLTGGLIIPSGITTVGKWAFRNCQNLTGTLTIPNSVTTIGEGAFYSCSGFTGSLTIPNSVTTIGSGAFYDCRNFTGALVIPDSVTKIMDGQKWDSGTFYGCKGFNSLVLSKNLTAIGMGTFNGCSGFTGNLIIPSGVTIIDAYAFYQCTGFTGSLTIPNTVTTIGDSAFYDCSGFTDSLIIPNSVTTIDAKAFYRCAGFTGNLTIPDTVTTIGTYAFYECKGFTGNLAISSGMTTIPKASFTDCAGITSVFIPTGITSITDSALAMGEQMSTVFGEKGSYAETWATAQKLVFVPIQSGFVGVLLNKTVLPLNEGESETLLSIVVPRGTAAQTLTWTSDNTAIVTVVNGKVTAVKGGTANITATSAIGKKATCAVTVKAKIIDITSVTLNKTTLPLTEGDSETLTATILPDNATDKTLTWASDDTAIATVVNGKVTAVKAGTANITATSANGKKATCAVTVKAKIIDVTGVTFNKTTLSLTEGDSETLTATILPDNATDKTLTWASDDTAIATVVNGKVTAVKAGTANITATSANGKKATCAVTVKAKIIDVTGVTFNKTTLSLTEGDSETLTATILPDNATDKTLTWASDDTAIATVDKDGKVTAVKTGTANITATSKNGKSATCTITVKPAVVPAETGVEGFVERLYTMLLGRASDPDGKANWIHQLKSRAQTGAQAAYTFGTSDEMKNRNVSDEEFLRIIYRTFFNREPDADGFAAWMSYLNKGISREFVICDFANSPEFQAVCNSFKIERGTVNSSQARDKDPNVTAFVNCLYTKLLDRRGEEGGLNAWTNEILRGAQTPRHVAQGFVFSNEFKAKSYDDATYIEYLYRTLMGRNSDAAGKENWLNCLKKGATREFVFNSFANSAEFKKRL